MRAFWRSLLTVATLGMVSVGCQKSETPAPSAEKATDVTLIVPAMN
jgi:hypothetical protein